MQGRNDDSEDYIWELRFRPIPPVFLRTTVNDLQVESRIAPQGLPSVAQEEK